MNHGAHITLRFAGVSLAPIVLCLLTALSLAGCKDKQNAFVPPPPPKVGVAQPLRQAVRPFIEATGNAVAFNDVDLVARVEGFLREIDYVDGEIVKTGAKLFVIEQPPYQAKLAQAQAALSGAKADLAQAQAEYYRQSTLAAKDFASQSKLDEARAKLGSMQGTVDSDDASLQIAAINLSYTQVNAPFDGIVTKHLISVGELVGSGAPTKLASILQIEPIYVTFNVSEQDVLRVRSMVKRTERWTEAELAQVPVEVGLMTEQGYPHRGVLNYLAPQVDASTGTLLVRAIFTNEDRSLLPGFFVRVRVPLLEQSDQLLVPDTALSSDQGGRYLLVVDKDNVVQQRHVVAGQLVGSLRVIQSGLAPEDRVIIGNIQRAIPGEKVDPQPATIAQADAPDGAPLPANPKP